MPRGLVYCHTPSGLAPRAVLSHTPHAGPFGDHTQALRGHPRVRGVLVSVVWTRAVCPERPQLRVNVRRSEVSGRGEVPSVGANLNGECGVVGKVENHGLRSVHPLAKLDLSVLYGR